MPEPVKPSDVVRDKKAIWKNYEITQEDVDECRAWVASAGWPPMIVKGFLKHMDADLVADAWCEHCNKRVKVRYPNYAGFVKNVQLVSEYLLQKMAERTQIDVNIRAIQATEDLEQLTDAELLAIEEGEWQPLPPAA